MTHKDNVERKKRQSNAIFTIGIECSFIDMPKKVKINTIWNQELSLALINSF